MPTISHKPVILARFRTLDLGAARRRLLMIARLCHRAAMHPDGREVLSTLRLLADEPPKELRT